MKLSTTEFESIKKVQEIAERDLLDKAIENVVGIGIGVKWVNNKPTEIPALMILVTEKVQLEKLSPNNIIPSEIEGVKTDVFSVNGVVKSLDLLPEGPHNTLDNFIRPVKGGYNIGSLTGAGTCGKIVRDAGNANFPTYYVLSNNHVLADVNNAKIGDPVIQPAGQFNNLGRYRVAALSDFVPIDFNFPNPNLVDAAIAAGELKNLSLEIYGIGYIDSWRTNKAVNQLPILTPVKKTGRTTDTSYGQIIAFNVSLNVVFRGESNIARFQQQIFTNHMGRMGDSGSLLVTVENNEAIGLLFGGNESFVFFNYIENVQNALNIVVADRKID